MIVQLEGSVDAKNVELVRDLMKEIEKLDAKSQANTEAGVDRTVLVMRQIGERIDNKQGELTDNLNEVKREFQRLLNERSRQLEQMTSANFNRVLELCSDLE